MIGPPNIRGKQTDIIWGSLLQAAAAQKQYPADTTGQFQDVVLGSVCEALRAMTLHVCGVDVIAIRKGAASERMIMTDVKALPSSASPAERSERALALLASEGAVALCTTATLTNWNRTLPRHYQVPTEVSKTLRDSLMQQYGNRVIQDTMDIGVKLAKKQQVTAYAIATSLMKEGSLDTGQLSVLFARHKILRRKARPLASADRKLVRIRKARSIDLARTTEIVFDPPASIPGDDVHEALKIMRHQYTNYDLLIKAFQNQPGRDQAVRILHDRVNDKLVKHYPQLKPAARLATRSYPFQERK